MAFTPTPQPAKRSRGKAPAKPAVPASTRGKATPTKANAGVPASSGQFSQSRKGMVGGSTTAPVKPRNLNMDSASGRSSTVRRGR
jgi:hypothetical protein